MQGAEIVATFKTHLRELMLKKSVELGYALNRSHVAEATGLSLPTISRWYKGEVDRIEAPTVEKLKGFFGCKFGDLVEWVD